jgi:hypothetical protein
MYNPLQSINAFQAGTDQRKARETEAGRMKIGNAFATGDYTGAANTAYGMGDLSTGMEISQYGKGLEDQAAEEKRLGLIKYGMGLLQTPAQQRESMRPQITQALTTMGIPLDEQAAAGMDLSDEGIKATLATLQDTDSLMAQYQSMMAPVEYDFQNVAGVGLVRTDPRAGNAEVAMASKRDPIVVNGILVDPETYEPVGNYQTPAQTGEMTDYQRQQLRLEQARFEQSSAAGANRTIRNDAKGVPRYVDTGEPVFPGVASAAKPLIGTETMARVATGLPNAKRAVAELETLLFNSKGTGLSMEGYSPLRDVGAGIVQDLGHIPVIGGAIRGATNSTARALGGEDYQMFEDSYDTFEAAMLPIMSGAAIPESEAKRQMQAVKIVPFDSQATKERKIAAQKEMISGLELAARGDVDGFLSSLDRAGKSVAEVESEEIDALVQQYGVR